MSERIALPYIDAPTWGGGTFGRMPRFLTIEELMAQANRCPGCGSPSCQIGCPIGNSIGDFHALIARGDLEGAADLRFNRTSVLASIIGSVCPQKDNGLCEDTNNCVAGRGDGESVMIGSIEASLGMIALQNGWIKPIAPLPGVKPKMGKHGRPRSLGIVGSGPAGLRAAEEAVKLGWEVTIYEKESEIGGLWTIGIPNFKINHILLKGILNLFQTCPQISINVNTEVSLGPGGHVSMDALAAKHDLLITANGAQIGKSVKHMDVWGIPGVHQAVRGLLRPQSLRNLGFRQDDLNHLGGKDVVVFGLGYTGIDCINTALAHDARSIMVVSSRVPAPDGDIAKNRRNGFNGYTLHEIADLKTKGVEFLFGTEARGYSPKGERGELTIDNKVGARRVLATDAVILAAGFDASYFVHSPPTDLINAEGYNYRAGLFTEHNGTPAMILGDAALQRKDRLVVKAAAQAANTFRNYHYQLYPQDDPRIMFARRAGRTQLTVLGVGSP